MTDSHTIPGHAAQQPLSTIPLPPPPPPPPSVHQTLQTSTPIKLRTRSDDAIRTLQTAHLTKSDNPQPQPGWYFVYGTLMDPGVLTQILHLDSPPPLHSATASNLKLKMWGQYPAAIASDSETDIVEGMAIEIGTQAHADALARYETRNYVVRECEITLSGENGERVSGFTFVSALPAQQLKEGTFSLEEWLKKTGRV